MTESQFYKSKDRIIKIPVYYIVENGKIILDLEAIENKYNDEIERVVSLAEQVKA